MTGEGNRSRLFKSFSGAYEKFVFVCPSKNFPPFMSGDFPFVIERNIRYFNVDGIYTLIVYFTRTVVLELFFESLFV